MISCVRTTDKTQPRETWETTDNPVCQGSQTREIFPLI